MADSRSLEELWIAYKCDGVRDDRNALLVHYTSLVRYVANKVAAGMPGTVDRDDLVSYGMFGLIDAIEKFDLGKGVKFETYAVSRIRGNIIDELRKVDWVPRSIRSKARDVERTYREMENELGRLPEETEVAGRMGITIQELWILLSQTAVASVTALDEHEESDERRSGNEMLHDPGANPEELFEAVEVTHLLARAVGGMSERNRTILVLYYLEEMNLAEIGDVLGVTESRVCQLQSKILQNLRESLYGMVAA